MTFDLLMNCLFFVVEPESYIVTQLLDLNVSYFFGLILVKFEFDILFLFLSWTLSMAFRMFEVAESLVDLSSRL